MSLRWIAVSFATLGLTLSLQNWQDDSLARKPANRPFETVETQTAPQSTTPQSTAIQAPATRSNFLQVGTDSSHLPSPVVPAQYSEPDEANPTRVLMGVDQDANPQGEPLWKNQQPIPWEVLGSGEFLGPIRRPFESNYRVRINDEMELTFAVSRKMLTEAYRIQMGDEIEINDANRPEISQQKQVVLDDGFISPLEVGQVHVAGKTVDQVNKILAESYRKAGTREPSITVSVTRNNTALRDLLESIQGQFNANGSIKQVRVSPDGTIQLPIIGRVCVYGLTLDEVGREVNLRYEKYIYNLNVTPALITLAEKTVFVFGEVAEPGVITLSGPTTTLGAIASAGGFLRGGNRRQVVVLRRDSQWRMVATKLDLAGAILGKTPIPSDDIWLRPSDIVIVPKQPIQRIAEFIDLYFQQSLFVLIPNQGISFNFDQAGNLN